MPSASEPSSLSQTSAVDIATGWEVYPLNLPSVTNDRFTYDHGSYTSRLNTYAQVYLSDKRVETRVQVTQICPGAVNNVDKKVLVGGLALDEHLMTNASGLQGCRIYELVSLDTYSNLLVSEECLRKLFSSVEAFPPILDIVHAFGNTVNPMGSLEVRSGISFANRSDPNTGVEESCWLLNHVEKHNRNQHGETWSVRKSGTYIKASQQGLRSDAITMNASTAMRAALKTMTSPIDALDQLKSICLSSSTRNWREYLDHMEARTLEAQGKISHQYNAAVDFDHMRRVKRIRQILCVAKTAIHRNLHVLKCIRQNSVPEIPATTSTSISKCSRILLNVAGQCEIELESLLIKIEDLFTRTSDTETLAEIASILDNHAAEASSNSNALVNESNNLMVDMTKQSVKDARTLKTITVLTLAYLPASFVSTFLSMGYITIKLHPFLLIFEPEMYIFGILTLFLLLITFGWWAGSEYRRWRRAKRDEIGGRFTKGHP